MTVQELINRLQQVEDKSKEVVLCTAWVDSEGDYIGTDCCEIEDSDIKELSDSFVISGCVINTCF